MHFSYRPFIDALSMHGTWYIWIVPMAFFIAVAYKAVRSKKLDHYWREVVVMTIQTLLGMAALAAALWLLAEVFVKSWMNAYP
ncbi:MAG: hypothetical protein ACK54T_05495 [bacterium]|jgi:uncharacterized membrane protein YwzB